MKIRPVPWDSLLITNKFSDINLKLGCGRFDAVLSYVSDRSRNKTEGKSMNKSRNCTFISRNLFITNKPSENAGRTFEVIFISHVYLLIFFGGL